MRVRLDPMMAGLLALALLLAAALWLAATRPIDMRPVADAAAVAAPGQGGLDSARPARPAAIGVYAETLARPLLEPTRRPVVASAAVDARPRAPAQAAPAAAPPPVAGLKLLGIVKADRQAPPRALIRASDGEAGQWVSEGGQLGRWRVEKIGEAAVVLEAQGSRIELAMFAAPRPLGKP